MRHAFALRFRPSYDGGVIDCPVGAGHVVLFANNPMWRGETQSSHALVFNAILNWEHLGAKRAPK
jgi:hypothetical protein